MPQLLLSYSRVGLCMRKGCATHLLLLRLRALLAAPQIGGLAQNKLRQLVLGTCAAKDP